MKLDSKSKDILKFRPKIDFVEPEQEEFEIKAEPVPRQLPDIDVVKKKRTRIKNYAKAIAVLAEATQSLIDKEAGEVIIQLDRDVDQVAIQAMRRTYPEATPNRVTYEQYKQCEEALRKQAEANAGKSAISQDAIAQARAQILKDKNVPIGGLGTEAATNGGLRPELDSNNQLIKPIDLDSFQNELLKVLVNTIWKNFFLPPFKILPFVGSAMPKELVPVSKSTKNMLGNIKEGGGETL